MDLLFHMHTSGQIKNYPKPGNWLDQTEEFAQILRAAADHLEQEQELSGLEVTGAEISPGGRFLFSGKTPITRVSAVVNM